MKKIDHWIALALVVAFFSACEGVGCSDELSPCDCEQSTTIEESGTLTNALSSGSIGNFEDQGGFYADAACHAEMFIYFEWQDTVMATTSQVPPITVSFETPTGYFPNPNIKVTETLLSTSPDGDVIHRRYYYGVNEAQSKSNPEGTSYRVSWVYDFSGSPNEKVTYGAYITSKTYDPNEYSRTNMKECAN